MAILSVRLSRPGTVPRPGEIGTFGLNHMIAQCLEYFVTKFHATGWRGSPRTRKQKRGTPL